MLSVAAGPCPIGPADDYRKDLEALVGSFEFELCDSCGHDVEFHVIGPDPLGKPHLYCVFEGEP